MHRRVLFLSLIAIACGSKDLDDTGADGADGEHGADGAGGEDGEGGSDGEDGDGEDGEDGGDGFDGFDGHSGEPPWGVRVEILSVEGGGEGPLQIGDEVTLTFTVEDDMGVPYALESLSVVEVQLSGPTEHYQVVFDHSDYDVREGAVWTGDAWRYTWPDPIPATWPAQPNDTTDLGVDDGDMGGEALVSGTYTAAASAGIYRTLDDGGARYESGSAAAHFLLGDATALAPREVVLQESCLSCHGELSGHAGLRRGLDYCLTCHVAGAEDRYSSEDPATTPGVTIGFTQLVHGIHMGERLEGGLVVNGYPGNPYGEGYPDYNAHDFSEAAFPAWPMGPATCAACHEGAADGDVEARPGRAACGSCHDSLDFESGAGHAGGAQASDDTCAGCHGEGGVAGDVLDDHGDPRETVPLTEGLDVEIIEVRGGSGSGGAFQVGDEVTVEFALRDGAGAAVDPGELAFSEATFSGPTDHYQLTLVSDYHPFAYASTFDGDAGTWSYTFPAPIPAAYPAQWNDTPDLGGEAGDLQGEALLDGTYTLVINAALEAVDEGGGFWYDSDGGVEHVLLGGAEAIGLREVVAQESCEGCHTRLEAHGGLRGGLEQCQVCHTAGSEDRHSDVDAGETPGVTVHLPVLIHGIHAGEVLSEPFTAYGYPGNPYGEGYPDYNVHDYSEVTFPRFEGGARACAACHEGSDAWTDPQTVACLSCHDSDDAAAHAAVNTDDTWGESCDVCHGPARDFAVDVVHAWPW